LEGVKADVDPAFLQGPLGVTSHVCGTGRFCEGFRMPAHDDLSPLSGTKRKLDLGAVRSAWTQTGSRLIAKIFHAIATKSSNYRGPTATLPHSNPHWWAMRCVPQKGK